MSDFMTVEQCRSEQHQCAVEREKKWDALYEKVNSTATNVARIMGYLRLNGGPDPAPHPHRRDSEEEERVHQRATDALALAETAAKKLIAAAEGKASVKAAADDENWKLKIMWGVGIFTLGGVVAPILAALGHAIAKRLFP